MTEKIHRLRRAEASVYLHENWGISRTRDTLRTLASIGGGPLIEYDGRIPLYRANNLDVWAQEQLSPPVHSVTELRMVRREVSR